MNQKMSFLRKESMGFILFKKYLHRPDFIQIQE